MVPKPLEHDRKVFAIFETVVDLPENEQAAFIEKACGGDTFLQKSVFACLDRAKTADSGLSFDNALLEKIKAEAKQFFNEQTPLEPGQHLAHYELVEKLGEGGMGLVFLANDLKLQRQVALKFLPHHLAIRPEMVKRFQKEGEAVARLNHPNIVTIHGIDHVDDHHFLVMEYLQGTTLDHHLKPHGLAGADFLGIAKPLLKALSAAHHAGMVHRDIKPANIMVQTDGTVKLLDFGLAKHLLNDLESNAVTQVPSSHLAGTFSYMAPEQIRQENITPAADIFSLGIVFAQMLTGRHPFSGRTGVEVATAILRDKPNPSHLPNRASQALFNFISKNCLHPDPLRRPSAEQLSRHLESKLAAAKTWRFASGKRAATAMFLLFAMVLVFLADQIAFNGSKDQPKTVPTAQDGIALKLDFLNNLDLPPGDLEVYKHAFQLYLEQNEDARALCLSLESKYPDHPAVSFFLANLLANDDQRKEAYALLQRTKLNQDAIPFEWTKRHVLGMHAMYFLDYPKAVNHYSILNVEFPDDIYAKLQLSQCLSEIGKSAEAIRVAEAALMAWPSSRTFDNYLFTLMENDKPEMAIELRTNPRFATIASDPDFIHWAMALCYMSQGDYSRAYENARKMAQSTNDTHSQQLGYLLISDIFALQGDLKRSIQTLVDHFPDGSSRFFKDNQTRFNLRLANRYHLTKGKAAEANQCIQNLMEGINFDSPKIWEFRHLSDLALLCLKVGDLDSSKKLIEAIKKLAEAWPSPTTSSNYRLVKGIYFWKTHQPEEAKNWLGDYQKEGVSTPAGSFWLGMWALDTGNFSMAEQRFKSILNKWVGRVLYRKDPALLFEVRIQLEKLKQVAQ